MQYLKLFYTHQSNTVFQVEKINIIIYTYDLYSYIYIEYTMCSIIYLLIFLLLYKVIYHPYFPLKMEFVFFFKFLINIL